MSATSQSSNASSAWAGGLDVDKTDLKRCSYFVHRKAYDLLQIELEPILESRTQLPPLDLEYGETRLRPVGVWWSVALARGFKIVDRRLENPQTQHWETTFRLFDLLL
jgi:Domain of unknown function (DUF1931)